MQNMLLKARAGRRMALLMRSVRQTSYGQNAALHAPSSTVQRPPQHQFLQRVSLSENRVSRLTLA